MNKIFGVIIGVLGIVLVILGGIMKLKENTAVSIVGGADGPTAVFVAGKLNDNLTFILIVIGIVLLGVAVIAFFKRKH